MAGLRYAELAQELCGRESLRGIYQEGIAVEKLWKLKLIG